MQRAIHLIKHVVICTAQQHSHCPCALAALQHDHVIVCYCFFYNLQPDVDADATIPQLEQKSHAAYESKH